MPIDPHTLAILLGLTNLLQLCIFLILYRTNKAHRWLGWWALGSASLVLAFGFNFMQKDPGSSPFSIAANLAFLLSGLALFYVGILHINQRLNEDYREAKEAADLIFNTSPDAVLITRLEDGRFVAINEGFTALSGYSRAEVSGKTSLEIEIWKNSSDRLEFVAELKEKGFCENREAVFQRKGGDQFFGIVSSRVLNLKGVPHIITVTRDITERKRDEIRIKELVAQLEIERDYAQKSALTDGLTRLANRRHFDEVLHTEFYRLKRSGAPLSVIMLDVDHFKKFNDQYGHMAGDECLRRVGRVMTTIVGRGSDLAARYGGEEFAVILPETDHQGAHTMAERLRRSIEELSIPHLENSTGDHVTVSLGVVTQRASELVSPDKMIELADAAMYRAKQAGRNRVELSASGGNQDAIASGLIRLVWREAAECGNAVIDAQHRALFEGANTLLSAVLDGKPKEAVGPLLEKLLGEIANHFRDEEDILRKAGFPFAESHGKCHTELVAKAMGLTERWERNELPLGELFSFLAYDVVAQHILREDRKFFPYVGGIV
ncbi:MAG: diguanylate cyclase [Holophaga sp.]|nr:diguanylate cyclase [Holophaga sp.]